MFVQLQQIVGETFKKFREPNFAELLRQPVSQKLKGKFRPDRIQGRGPTDLTDGAFCAPIAQDDSEI